ncbi:MAG: serine/threonine-protein kinase [Candidatus Sumerlaea chitinivorans]|jgi:serine/threonine protein kinase|uniref:Serine/threonine protein kinase PpkA n=1 Tax=Sumerlaea chitinivorans TaxID=2250252 RepID=A0A2Z4Y607_SUMC1|nr:Serine/threonine protein kinase PpkA [Candidatus Sumerlaea chitinivorans]MCX7964078.1 serine/threonine-protein kinase [Candidatus Sumerlaea chitinivorans]
MSNQRFEEHSFDLPGDVEETFRPAVSVPESSDGEAESAVDAEAPTVGRVVFEEDEFSSKPSSVDYILQQRIAEGGFAEIWEALQVPLGRVVAIKRLKVQGEKEGGRRIHLPSAHVHAMFRHEAIVAGHLEHPNILPVYDLAYDEEGRPMLVMKRVRGQLWSDLLREDFPHLSVEEFLGKHLPILLSVAQAVAYAHSQGVVHRDLKPAQVMIGAFGEVLLMDWGLAMAYPRRTSDPQAPPWLRDPRSPLNHPTNPAGTPAYMAPEQTIATPEKLGPWTDIYLLGAILYRLLTGTAPHPGKNGDETFEYARQGLVIPPQEAAPKGRRLPSGLTALAMRCLSYDPKDRPHSVGAFIEALQGCMSGAKNRQQAMTLVEGVAERLATSPRDYAVLAECINTLDRALQLYPDYQEAIELRTKALAAYARLALANRDLKLARVQAERLPAGSERETLLAHVVELEEMQRRQAEALERANRLVRDERDRAEQIIEFLLGHFHRSLRRVGRLELLRQLADELNNYFSHVSVEVETEQTRRNRMGAYQIIAQVFTEQGDKRLGLEMCQRAIALASHALELHPNDPYWMARKADCYDHISTIEYYQGKYDEARTHSEMALELRRRVLFVAFGDEAEANFARSLHKRGIIEWRCRNLDEALQLHVEAETILRRLTLKHSNNEDYESSLAAVLATLGNVYRDRGEVDTAIVVTREALALRERLMERDPADIPRRDELVWTRNNLALMHLVKGEYEEALQRFQENLPILRRRAHEDSSNVNALGDLAFALSLLGEILFLLGKIVEADPVLNEALVVTRTMLRRAPESVYAKISFARVASQLAELMAVYGSREHMERFTAEAVPVAKEAYEQAPSHPMAAKVFCRAKLLEAYLALQQGQEDQVSALCRVAAESAEGFHLPSEETDYLEATAERLLLEGRLTEAEPLLAELEKRRWVTPFLRKLANSRSAESTRSENDAMRN